MRVGWMALATPGACSKPATRALAVVTVASSILKSVADSSGTERKANPAVRTSPRMKIENIVRVDQGDQGGNYEGGLGACKI